MMLYLAGVYLLGESGTVVLVTAYLFTTVVVVERIRAF